MKLLQFLQDFNNSTIDEVEKIYCIFYQINPKDYYKTSKLEKLNLTLEITPFSELSNSITNALNENITESIKEICNEIEEFKNYYLKYFNEENSANTNMLNVIPEENIWSSQDLNISPKSDNTQFRNRINSEKLLDEKEIEILNLKEKFELLELNYNDLQENQSNKIQELTEIIENLNKNKNNNNTKDAKDKRVIDGDFKNKNLLDLNYDDEEEDDLNLNNINICIEEKHEADNYVEKNIKNKQFQRAKKIENLNFKNSKEKDNTNQNSQNQMFENNEEEIYKSKFLELSDEYKKLKLIFDECTQTIYDAIRIYSPNILEDENISFQISPSGKLHKDNNSNNNNIYNMIMDSKGSQISAGSNISMYSDMEFISKAVEIFKKYNQEINEKHKKLESDLQEAESKIQLYKITAEEYKKALNISLKKSIGNSAFSTKQEGKIINLDEKDFNNEDYLNLNNFILPELNNASNSRNNNELALKNEEENNLNNSIQYMKFEEVLTGTFSKTKETGAKEKIEISKNNKIFNNEIANENNQNKLIKIHSEEATEKSLFAGNSNSNETNNDHNNNLEELIKKYKEDIYYLNYEKIQTQAEHKKELISAAAEKHENKAEIAGKSESSLSKKCKQKIETFCNFTVEDLIEPENHSSLNQNLCDGNNLDFENIRVNIKSFEKFNNPERYKIVAKKSIKNDFIWYLLADKLIDLDFFSYETLLWIPAKLIESKLTLYEIDKSADIDEKNSINSMRQSKSKQCISCLKRSNSRKSRSSYDININQINEKETKNANLNLNPSSSNRDNVNNNVNRSYNTENSSSRNFENFENYESIENEENVYYNNLQKDIRLNALLREKNMEIEKLSKTEKDLNSKLNDKKIEFFEAKQLCEKLLKVNKEPVNSSNSAKIVSFDKYELLFNQYKKEQDKRSDLAKKYEEIKTELESANKLLESYSNEINKKTKKAETKNGMSYKGNKDSGNIKSSLDAEKESFQNLISAKNQDKASSLLFNNAKNKFCDFTANDVGKAYPGSLVCNTYAGVNNLNFTLNSSINIESEAREKHVTEGAFIVFFIF